VPEAPQARRSARTRVNWEVLESRTGESSDAYQRPVIRRKIEEICPPDGFRERLLARRAQKP